MSTQLALLFATCLVAACGGGGGDSAPAPSTSSTTTPAPAPAPGPAPAPAPSPAPAPAPSAALPTATCGLANFASQALTLVNQKRAAGATCGTQVFPPAGPLAWNALLNQAATGHSADMSAQNYFSHTSADGRTLRNRIEATGYAWSSIGENIAAGYSTVQVVVDAWMASPGHCVNIMTAAFTEMGLACVAGNANSTYGNYWTMDLAKPQ